MKMNERNKKTHQDPLRLIVLALESQRKQSADYYNKIIKNFIHPCC